MTGVKPAVMNKHEFEERNETLLVAFVLKFLDSHDFDARMKVKDFSIERFSTRVGFSNETLLEEIKLVVSEKVELKNGDKCKLKAFFQLWTIKKMTLGSKRMVF